MEANLVTVAIMVITGLIFLTLLLGLIPVCLRVKLGSEVKSVTIRFWKLTIIDSESPGKMHRRKSPKAPKEASRKKSAQRGVSTVSERWSQALQYMEIAPRITKALLGFIVRLVGKMHLRDVQGSVAGGFSDPADTGMAFGALYALRGAAPALQSRLQVKPDYLAERITYDLSGEITLRPVELIGPTLRLLYELPKRELLRIMRSRRRKSSVKETPQ